MKLRKQALIGLAVLGVAASPLLQAQQQATDQQEAENRPQGDPSIRTIKLNEDRDQKFKGSKVYELKHTKPDDITPFILGAVKRYNAQGDVQRLTYKVDGKIKAYYLVVSTGVEMMPYIDQMVKDLDHPCEIRDDKGSNIKDDGIYKFTYFPKYRAGEVMNETIKDLRSDGLMYFDPATNLFYWKDSNSDGNSLMNWLQTLDRPVPQVQVSINVYEMNENDFKELGIDYVAWKNGPGAQLFGAGYNFLSFNNGDSVNSLQNLLNITSNGPLQNAMGGFMVAPQFDATFLRMLSQKGKARVATSSTITVVNDYTTADPGNDNFAGAKYKLRFAPNYQNINKDSNMNTSVDQQPLDCYFYLRSPIISFNEAANSKGGANSVAQLSANAAMLNFGWVLRVEDTVEQTTTNGQPLVNQHNFRSWTTLACGSEKLVGTFTKDSLVKQDIGMPFLGDIPVLKYLFGTSVDSRTNTRVFVTISATPVTPEADLSKWAGEIITTADMAKATLNADKK
ncbi:MAG: hypothetical protein A2X49_16625 [Lentisphaerae bacterium GWF2_52_8]|nr:MAG: hypothetical protein A2X49_16625 [Lentisphaerae bacterium GWF2_52_8]